MKRSVDKGFGFSRAPDPAEPTRAPQADPKFMASGTEVDGLSGFVAAPVAKRLELMAVTQACLAPQNNPEGNCDPGPGLAHTPTCAPSGQLCSIAQSVPLTLETP